MENYVYELESTIVSLLDKIVEYSDEKDYYTWLSEISGFNNSMVLDILDRGNMYNQIRENFNALKTDKKDEWNYDLGATFSDYEKYIKMGNDSKEKLQIFLMLYVYEITKNELENWTLLDLIKYIYETDELYNEDKKYIIACCNEITDNNIDNEIQEILRKDKEA